MRSLLSYIAIACSLSLSVSGTFFTGDQGKHADHGVEGWKALVASGIAHAPKEAGAHVGKRAEPTSTATATTDATTDPTTTKTTTTTDTLTATTTTATGPSPWVSLDAEGSPVTITPAVTTDAQGSPSTADAAPTSTGTLGTDTDKDDSHPHHVDVECSESSYQDGGKWAPFCLPQNGSEWRVDSRGGAGFYYVTWNPAAFSRNETVHMSLNFLNQTDEAGAAGIWATVVAASIGFVDVHPLSDWFDDAPQPDNVDLYLVIKGSTSGKLYTGPTITLTTRPKPPKVDTSPNNRPAVNTLGLAVGLPVVLVFIVVMVLGTHFCMRERRKVGPIHIGGVRGRKEYGTRMSRRQRLKGGVPLAQEGYTDERGEEDEHGVPPVARNSTGGWELTNVQGGKAREYDEDAREYNEREREGGGRAL